MKAIARTPFPSSRSFMPGVALAMLALSGCSAVPPAAPPPVPVVRPALRPAPAPVATPTDWRDLPLTAGAWQWSAAGGVSRASYGVAGAAPQITMTCQNSRVRLGMPGLSTMGGVIVITTTTQVRQASAEADTAGAALTLNSSDRLLDAIAFTRGRWQVEVAGHAPLVLPADASASRVIEDCRAPRR